MSMSVGSTSDALANLGSLLQSVANTAGRVAGVGPVGDFLAGIAKSASGSSGAAPSAQAFGMAPQPFPDNTMAALIALKGQDTGGSAQSPFATLDTDGDGGISKSELENALGSSGVDQSSADALFAKLDRNGDGSVDQGELTSALRRGHGRHHMAAGGSGGGQGIDALLNATGADGSKSTTATNADGSTSTTITYADGSTVTMTTPAAATNGASSDGSSSSSNKSSANLIEQLVKMQAQLVSQQGATVSAIA